MVEIWEGFFLSLDMFIRHKVAIYAHVAFRGITPQTRVNFFVHI